MTILSQNMKNYITTKKKHGYNLSAYNDRLIEYAKQGWKDLEFIAEEVNEDNGFKPQDVDKILSDIFMSANIEGLLTSILLSKRIDPTIRLKIAKAMVEMLPEIALELCNDDYQKLMMSGHDSSRASLYAVKWAGS